VLDEAAHWYRSERRHAEVHGHGEAEVGRGQVQLLRHLYGQPADQENGHHGHHGRGHRAHRHAARSVQVYPIAALPIIGRSQNLCVVVIEYFLGNR
jgi:hypothetical protein